MAILRLNEPYWVEAQTFDGTLNYTGHAPDPTWKYIQNFTGSAYFNASEWVIVQNFDGAMPSNTTWLPVQVFTGEARRGLPIWTEVQVFDSTIDQEPNWTWAQEYTGQVRSRDAVYVEGSNNWIEAVVFLVILWLPALIMGWFAPTYGTVIGVCIMGAVLLFQDSAFIFVFVMILINSAVMFWKSGGDG